MREENKYRTPDARVAVATPQPTPANSATTTTAEVQPWFVPYGLVTGNVRKVTTRHSTQSLRRCETWGFRMQDPIAEIRAGQRDSIVLEGLHALKHAFRFGAQIEGIFTTDRVAALSLVRELAPDLISMVSICATEVSDQILNRHSGRKVHTRIITVARRREWVIDDVQISHRRPAVLLDDPRNLGNVGAVVRVAAAADTAGVLIAGPVDPFDTTVTRGAAGLQFALPVVSLTVDAIPRDLAIVAFDADGEDFGSRPLPPRAIFAFGSERSGISPALRNRASRIVSLPMRAGVSSLNLATAVSAALYLAGYQSPREEY